MSTVNYIPYGRNILVDTPKEDQQVLGSGLITIDSLSDKELQAYGGTTKSAIMANKNSEEQAEYTVVAIGPKVDPTEVQVGDIVLFRPAVQAITIEIDGKYYYQAGEFEVAGKMIR